MRNKQILFAFQSASLPIALGFVLFLAAGTFGYWQAWLYLIVFSLAIRLIGFYLVKKDPALMERRQKMGNVGETATLQKIVTGIAGVCFFASFVVAGLDRRFGWSFVPSYLVVIADILIAIAFYIVYLVFKENTFTSSVIEVDKNQKVISTGPYAVVRHPMYSGAILLIVATPIALGSFWALLLVLPLVLLIVLRLLDEEKFLSKNLTGYTEYLGKTRYRLIPAVW